MGPGARMPKISRGQGPALAALRIPQYRWLFASNMAFFFAMQGQMVVRLLIVWELTQDKAMLGYTSFAVAVPMVLISPFGGVIADRMDRRKLILFAAPPAFRGWFAGTARLFANAVVYGPGLGADQPLGW